MQEEIIGKTYPITPNAKESLQLHVLAKNKFKAY